MATDSKPCQTTLNTEWHEACEGSVIQQTEEVAARKKEFVGLSAWNLGWTNLLHGPCWLLSGFRRYEVVAGFGR